MRPRVALHMAQGGVHAAQGGVHVAQHRSQTSLNHNGRDAQTFSRRISQRECTACGTQDIFLLPMWPREAARWDTAVPESSVSLSHQLLLPSFYRWKPQPPPSTHDGQGLGGAHRIAPASPHPGSNRIEEVTFKVVPPTCFQEAEGRGCAFRATAKWLILSPSAGRPGPRQVCSWAGGLPAEGSSLQEEEGRQLGCRPKVSQVHPPGRCPRPGEYGRRSLPF